MGRDPAPDLPLDDDDPHPAPNFPFGDDDPDFVTYKCNSLAVNHIQWYPPDSLIDDYDILAPGKDLLHVSYTDVDMYTPTSILGEGPIDYILSTLACNLSIDNATRGHLDPGSQSTTIP